MEDFDLMSQSAQGFLTNRYDPEKAKGICGQAKELFAELLPDLPFIGGDQNPATEWLVLAAMYVAFYRPTCAEGMTAEECGGMMYEAFVEKLNKTSKEKWLESGRLRMSPQGIELMKKWADSTKNLTSPYDWVASFVSGEDQSFTYGIDYYRCGTLQYFKDQGAFDLAPYYCLVDFPMHEMMDVGLERLQTLAMGDDGCTFRFKIDQPTKQDWSTEISKIRERFDKD
jgi:hypothetical protein